MKVVVTGASGNVGTAVMRSLVAEPRVEEVVAVARRIPRADARGASPGSSDSKVSWISADLANDTLRGSLEGAHAVVHLGWSFLSQHQPVRTWAANVRGAIDLYEAAATAGVRVIIHASSVGAYAPRVDSAPVDESWPTHALPSAAYGREKSYLERYLDTYETRHPDLRVVRLRSAFVFQPTASREQLRIFAGAAAQKLLRPTTLGALPVLPLPCSLILQAVHADDLADAYHSALMSDVHGAFNIAADPPLDGPTLAALIGTRCVPVPDGVARAAMAMAFHLRLIPTEPGLLQLALSLPVMSTRRARTELGWNPQRTSEQTIRAFLDGLDPAAAGTTPPLADDQGPEPARPSSAIHVVGIASSPRPPWIAPRGARRRF